MQIDDESDVYEAEIKEAKFYPSPSENHNTTEEYVNGIRAILPLDRNNIRVLIPFNSSWDQLMSILRKSQRHNLALYVGNMLVEMAKKLSSKQAHHSTLDLQRLASGANNKQYDDAKIPPKYRPFLRKLDVYVKERNDSAHNTAGEFAAMLLSEEFKSSSTYFKWKEGFPAAYDKTIEELARIYEDEQADDIF